MTDLGAGLKPCALGTSERHKLHDPESFDGRAPSPCLTFGIASCCK